MNLKNGAKRAAKFTFVDMPLSILGWRQIKANNGYIRDLWRTLRNPLTKAGARPCMLCNP